VFHHRPSLGGAVEVSPYRPATSVMIASPPRSSQNVSAAPSSDERSMPSSAWRSADESLPSLLDSCASRSSAMNSLATDAIAISWSLPLDRN
jgi:hypothetical protein